ncbi:hypothetical protein HUT18_17560 [Streptomyces sp. NA04227]|uniref:hypothetical protein n=1 Tax=Streptomyces sp. NA04227 TaxID=2742136 RepID=UPI0015905D5D|nr:hypothetical protein [Streptomyces sp. NA04227]QKW07926.1 hypothetical protein HUT18_17560 [Streptomyces sp. NA04227]
MDWTTPVSTLIGAVVGVGSTLLAESLRSRRDRGTQHESLKRELYARYLAALTATDSELQLLAVRHRNAGPVDELEIRDAWRSHALLALKYEIQLVAPAPVSEAAEQTYRRLRELRNAVGTQNLATRTSALDTTSGPDTTPSPDTTSVPAPRSEAWQTVHTPYVDALETLRVAMRADLGGPDRDR